MLDKSVEKFIVAINHNQSKIDDYFIVAFVCIDCEKKCMRKKISFGILYKNKKKSQKCLSVLKKDDHLLCAFVLYCFVDSEPSTAVSVDADVCFFVCVSLIYF